MAALSYTDIKEYIEDEAEAQKILRSSRNYQRILSTKYYFLAYRNEVWETFIRNCAIATLQKYKSWEPFKNVIFKRLDKFVNEKVQQNDFYMVNLLNSLEKKHKYVEAILVSFFETLRSCHITLSDEVYKRLKKKSAVLQRIIETFGLKSYGFIELREFIKNDFQFYKKFNVQNRPMKELVALVDSLLLSFNKSDRNSIKRGEMPAVVQKMKFVIVNLNTFEKISNVTRESFAIERETFFEVILQKSTLEDLQKMATAFISDDKSGIEETVSFIYNQRIHLGQNTMRKKSVPKIIVQPENIPLSPIETYEVEDLKEILNTLNDIDPLLKYSLVAIFPDPQKIKYLLNVSNPQDKVLHESRFALELLNRHYRFRYTEEKKRERIVQFYDSFESKYIGDPKDIIAIVNVLMKSLKLEDLNNLYMYLFDEPNVDMSRCQNSLEYLHITFRKEFDMPDKNDKPALSLYARFPDVEGVEEKKKRRIIDFLFETSSLVHQVIIMKRILKKPLTWATTEYLNKEFNNIMSGMKKRYLKLMDRPINSPLNVKEAFYNYFPDYNEISDNVKKALIDSIFPPFKDKRSQIYSYIMGEYDGDVKKKHAIKKYIDYRVKKYESSIEKLILIPMTSKRYNFILEEMDKTKKRIWQTLFDALPSILQENLKNFLSSKLDEDETLSKIAINTFELLIRTIVDYDFESSLDEGIVAKDKTLLVHSIFLAKQKMLSVGYSNEQCEALEKSILAEIAEQNPTFDEIDLTVECVKRIETRLQQIGLLNGDGQIGL